MTHVLERSTAQTLIYKLLRQRLIEGEFLRGQKIPEKELEEALEVSRTPLREALARLEQEGLLVSRPYTGYFVREYTDEEINGLLDTRSVLESAAAEAAARIVTGDELASLKHKMEECEACIRSKDVPSMVNANNDFHFEIARLSGNPWLLQLMQIVQAHFGIVRLSSHRDASRRAITVSEHRKIYEAIAAHDPEKSAKRVRDHLANARESQIEQSKLHALENSLQIGSQVAAVR